MQFLHTLRDNLYDLLSDNTFVINVWPWVIALCHDLSKLAGLKGWHYFAKFTNF